MYITLNSCRLFFKIIGGFLCHRLLVIETGTPMKDQIPWNLLLHHLMDKETAPDPLVDEWIRKKENQQFWDELQVIYSVNGNIPG